MLIAIYQYGGLGLLIVAGLVMTLAPLFSPSK